MISFTANPPTKLSDIPQHTLHRFSEVNEP